MDCPGGVSRKIDVQIIFIDSCPIVLDYIYHTIVLSWKAIELYLYVFVVDESQNSKITINFIILSSFE